MSGSPVWDWFERAYGGPLLGRDGFDRLVAEALDSQRGFAAGKLGNSERGWLRYPIVRERERDPRRLTAYRLATAHRGALHSGIYPRDAAFLDRFCDQYARAVGELDAIGIFADDLPDALELFAYHQLRGAPMAYFDQEPERSSPADEDRCWLRHLRGRRILLLSPFAELLRERANRDDYDASWAKIGKRWFEPASVEAIEFPYGFDPRTRERHPSALDLFDEIRGRVAAADFDIALIGAGGLGIPLAGEVKRLGRIGVSLGGHLQVVFGVAGERWLERQDWQRLYMNDSWIAMPGHYAPAGPSGENYW